jgi:hypothetical protein
MPVTRTNAQDGPGPAVEPRRGRTIAVRLRPGPSRRLARPGPRADPAGQCRPAPPDSRPRPACPAPSRPAKPRPDGYAPPAHTARPARRPGPARRLVIAVTASPPRPAMDWHEVLLGPAGPGPPRRSSWGHGTRRRCGRRRRDRTPGRLPPAACLSRARTALPRPAAPPRAAAPPPRRPPEPPPPAAARPAPRPPEPGPAHRARPPPIRVTAGGGVEEQDPLLIFPPARACPPAPACTGAHAGAARAARAARTRRRRTHS